MSRLHAFAFVPVFAAFAAYAPGARAQSQSAAISLTIDPSVRSRSLGGASTAVFWGDEPNAWANPALLGGLRGVHYEYHSTQTIPSLADDVYMKAERVDFGAAGVGFALGGEPNDHLGRSFLDYGEIQGTGSFHSFEDIDSWAVGVDLLAATENLLSAVRLPVRRWSRWGDVSLGYATKRVKISLAPTALGGSLERATVHDRGLLLRFTPFDTIERSPGPGTGFRVDLAYGRCLQNTPDTITSVEGSTPSQPIARITRDAVGARIAVGVPGGMQDDFADLHLGWLVHPSTRLLEVGLDFDHDTPSFPTTPQPYSVLFPAANGGRDEFSTSNAFGVELRVLEMASLRIGHERNRDADVDGTSYGLGFGLRYGDIAGIRFDWGRFAIAEGLADAKGIGVAGFVDGVALVRRARTGE